MALRCVLTALALTMAAAMSASAGEQDGTPALREQPSPVRLIGARCVFCHGPVLMLGFSRRMLQAGGPAALDEFLATHHAPDREAREAIVDFLSQPVKDAD